VREKVQEVAHAVGQKAEDAKAAVGSGMQSLGHKIESGGKYLQEEDLKSIAQDLTNVVRRNPIPAMLVGIGLGFLVGCALRR
jgi:hypothetical protein